jgi:carboxypeptidase C (cathepsin A)
LALGRGRGQAEAMGDLRRRCALDASLRVLVVHGFTDLVTPFFTYSSSRPAARLPGRRNGVDLKCLPRGT